MNARLPPGGTPGPFDWLVRIVAALITAAVLIASFFIGAVVALALLGVAMIVWAVLAFRWWQFRRRWRQAQRDDGTGSTTIEGDYRVVHDREDERR